MTKTRLGHTDNEAGLSSPRHWPTYDSCLSASTADGRTVNDVMTHYSPSMRTANTPGNVLRMPAHRTHGEYNYQTVMWNGFEWHFPPRGQQFQPPRRRER